MKNIEFEIIRRILPETGLNDTAFCDVQVSVVKNSQKTIDSPPDCNDILDLQRRNCIISVIAKFKRKEKSMYKIGELSKLCNISVKALRYYDSEGLLIPDKIDKFTGYRYYSASKLVDCYRIIALKELGFSLDEIRKQLTIRDNEQIAGILNAKLAELKSLIESTECQLRKIKSIKNGLTEGEPKMFHVIIKTTDEVRVAFVRKYYKSKSDALLKADEIAGKLPKTIVGKRRIVINYETEYKESDFDLAACAEITGNLPQSSAYDEKMITFGKNVASLCCQESELDEAYKAIIQHLDSSNYKICGAYYEIYHSDRTVELKVPVSEKSKTPLYVIENADKPFTDDPEVCGKWKMLDIVPTHEHFVYGKPKCSHLAWLHELYFIDGGKNYWAVNGWTKNFLFTYGPKPDTRYVNRYTIENIDGHRLLFLEMTCSCDDDGVGFDIPEIWVYEKADDKHYISQEEFRRCDNIDYPFIHDKTVIGKWKVRDFIIHKEDFDPERQNWKQNDLFVLAAEFQENGVYVSTTQNGTNGVTCIWTKGLVLNKREKTASTYEIKMIDGKEYLFREWKPGDYSFGGGRSYWYVFTRE